MEQACYKCGQLVEEGRPFCPHCAAPQIRVLLPEPIPGPLPAGSGLASEGQAALPASQTVPVLALPVQWSRALKPCALAAVVAFVLMLLGLNLLVAMLSVGFLAVVFYRHGQGGLAIRAGTGVRLGAFSGLLCFGLTALLLALAAAIPDLREKLRGQLLENANKWAATHPSDPRIQTLLDQLKTPEGFIMALIIGGAMLFVLSIVLGSLGGVLGGAIFRRRDRP
jgi:hypothetical protein